MKRRVRAGRANYRGGKHLVSGNADFADLAVGGAELPPDGSVTPVRLEPAPGLGSISRNRIATLPQPRRALPSGAFYWRNIVNLIEASEAALPVARSPIVVRLGESQLATDPYPAVHGL